MESFPTFKFSLVLFAWQLKKVKITTPMIAIKFLIFLWSQFKWQLTICAYVSSGILKLRPVPQAERNYENKT
jgi:hypothetical protein